MSDLDHAIAKLAVELHPDRFRAFAGALMKAGANQPNTALVSYGAGIPAGLLKDLDHAWQKAPCALAELGVRIQTAATVAALANNLSSTELVWTGPSSGLVAVRHTEQVLTGLIDGAQSRLFLVSFVAYKIHGVMEALASAAARGVQISVLLEKSEESGGNVSVDSLASIRSKVPKAAFYAWDQNISGEQFAGASVHAKCAVADGREAFITSANLTSAAMERNMEAGVLVRGGVLPAQLDKHLFALVTTNHLKRL